MISIGNIEISQVRHGGVMANGVYLGSNKLWPEDAPVPVQSGPVKFVANEAGATVGLVKDGSPSEVSLVYSLDGSTWSDYTIGQIFTLSNVGDMFCIRAKTTNSAFSTNWDKDFYQFSTTGDLSLMGNINTLLAADGEVESAGWFSDLFKNTTITDAGGLELPSVAVHANGYAYLFYGCSSMVVGPKRLPMLDNRAAGDSWPSGTYFHMFDGCSSLIESPVIDVEYGPLNTLEYMFQGCTSLRKITLSKATTWNRLRTSDWVNGVSSTGEFVCKASLPDTRGNRAIPPGWTKVDIDSV